MGIIVCCMSFAVFNIGAVYSFIIMLPLIFDGFLQGLTSYESNNLKRIVTGILFGYGIMSLFFYSIIFTFNLGYSFGKTIF